MANDPRSDGSVAEEASAFGRSSSPSSNSTWSNKNLVTGLYDTPDAAGKAYQDLTSLHGYNADDISVVMSDDTRKRHFGAALGALVATATAIAIPGLGLVVAGPIAGAIAGAGAGGATGTLVGTLIGAGIPENRAAEYERGVKEGGIVLGTHAKDEAQATELEREFNSHGARNVPR